MPVWTEHLAMHLNDRYGSVLQIPVMVAECYSVLQNFTLAKPLDTALFRHLLSLTSNQTFLPHDPVIKDQHHHDGRKEKEKEKFASARGSAIRES